MITDPKSLRLCQLVVSTGYDQDGEETRVTRWTLGPEWYENNESDEDIAPYAPLAGALNSPHSIRAAQEWAVKAIAHTSDYKVMGWIDDFTPELAYVFHQLTIVTAAKTYHIDVTGQVAASSVETLRSCPPDGMLTFKSTSGDGETTSTLIIPTSRVDSLQLTTTQRLLA